jgi:L-seryl-tRNA(Ser) seleniumtransferase
MKHTAGLRALPSVEELARHPSLRGWSDAAPAVRLAARAVLESERAIRLEGATEHGSIDALAGAVDDWLVARLSPGPHKVINATGVVVHTNLGRAPLSGDARDAMLRAAGACDLELDLRSGKRGSRQDHIVPLLATLCGAEDAVVVTNNAAAVLLALTVLCKGKEVLVSRGEAVEIGGGFRIPEVMRLSGARMVDVGTTNRTRAADYTAAVTSRTAAIVRVHPSNFAVIGFVERPTTAECAALARRHDILLIEDAGSGALTDPVQQPSGMSDEPVLSRVIADGADLVTASGDKLCGGPQAGLIAGRAELIGRLRRHPLMRALRPDKLVLAALGATLAAHLRGDATESVPVPRMLAQTGESLAAIAARWADRLAVAGIPADTRIAASTAGGGALPGSTLPTTCVTLPGPTGRLLAALRLASPPVIARAVDGRVWLDPRTVARDDDDPLLEAVRAAWDAVHGGRRGPTV